ncbi:hypothetical protein NP493_559g00031 [Ridgeia piscesae]|uniref:Tetraspanin n=1 Tax=Ridgeia piscesae TaxID=27915 RepID=A0AAD9KWG6_RIDPI|nr:hypothetical protein NP493_559g00031 [Ridgeia piscesae]
MGNSLMTISIYVIISAGCVIVVASFVGFSGSLNDNRSLAVTHVSLVSVAYVLLLIGGSLAVAFRLRRNVDVRLHMKETLINHYGVDLDDRWNSLVTYAWDKAQDELYCCAVADEGWKVYRDSTWFKLQPAGETSVPPVNRKHVPESCCERTIDGRLRHAVLCQTWHNGPPAKTSGIRNYALHYKGCYDVGIAFVYTHSGYLIGMSFGLSFVILLGLVLLIAVFRLCHPGEYTGVCTAPVRSSAPRPRHQTHHVLAARPAREAPAAAEPYHHQPVYCERSSDGWFS